MSYDITQKTIDEFKKESDALLEEMRQLLVRVYRKVYEPEYRKALENIDKNEKNE